MNGDPFWRKQFNEENQERANGNPITDDVWQVTAKNRLSTLAQAVAAHSGFVQ